jgi:hypothetical protein
MLILLLDKTINTPKESFLMYLFWDNGAIKKVESGCDINFLQIAEDLISFASTDDILVLDILLNFK